MVLESIVTHLRAERRPAEMLPFGFIIASVGIFLAIWVFRSYASFAMVTFTVMAVLPMMVSMMRYEKEKQESLKNYKTTVHMKALWTFVFLFIGFLFAYTFWFLLLPINVANDVFFLQVNTLSDINSATGAAITQSNILVGIFVNNLRVLALSALFSFIFGSGAIFILAWNASVIGVAMATTIKIGIAAGGGSSAGYFGAFSYGILRFFIHGIPEMASYFIAALAGAIVSFALLDIKKKDFHKRFMSSFRDASLLLVGSFVLVLISALLEVYVTPLLVS